MRFAGLILALMLPLVVGCKILPQSLDEPQPSAATQDEAVASDENSLAVGIRPRPRPSAKASGGEIAIDPAIAATPAVAAVPTEDVVRKSSEQIVCEKRGGSWSNAGKSNLKACIKRTRDAGKQCRKQGDCDSACLARSGTCAPVKPLFGCNEILQKDGSRVTLCID